MSGFVVQEDAAEPVNYRQVGRGVQGKIKQAGDSFEYQAVGGNSTMKVRLKKTTPSIPTKFATTIHVGQRERNAFGTRINRFSAPDSECPGPGSYHKPASLELSREVNTNVSKLGYGVGFVSKTDRFSDKPFRQAAVAPAPGQYHTGDLASVLMKSSHSVAPVTSTFVKPAKYRDDPTLPVSEVSGPGQYDSAVSSIRITTKPIKHSVTQPRITRAPFSAPPPGAYEVVPTMRPAPGLSSNFKSSVERFPDGLAGPAATAEPSRHGETDAFLATAAGKALKSRRHEVDPLGAAASLLSTVAAHPHAAVGVQLGTGVAVTVPGPGAYNPALLPAKMDMTNVSSLFGSADQLDRWGNPVQRRAAVGVAVPGPGAYDVTVSTAVKPPAAANVFKSGVQRGIVPPDQTPGPAYYKPASPQKKSHLLNSLHRWL